MKNSTLYLTLLLGLLVGGLLGAIFFPKEVPVIQTVEVVKEVPTVVYTPGETVIKNNPDAYLDQALDDVWQDQSDRSRFRQCNPGSYEYDSDQVSLDRVLNYVITVDREDETREVQFSAVYKFDDSTDDEKPCKVTRHFTVLYEEGEEPDVSWGR